MFVDFLCVCWLWCVFCFCVCCFCRLVADGRHVLLLAVAGFVGLRVCWLWVCCFCELCACWFCGVVCLLVFCVFCWLWCVFCFCVCWFCGCAAGGRHALSAAGGCFPFLLSTSCFLCHPVPFFSCFLAFLFRFHFFLFTAFLTRIRLKHLQGIFHNSKQKVGLITQRSLDRN